MVSHFALPLASENVRTIPSAQIGANDCWPAVSIIVPTLNEAENIDRVLGDIVDNLDGRFHFEIIVTDGGSTDGTCEKAMRWENTPEYAVSLVRNGGGAGLAADVMSAASQARFPILVVLDADGSHPVSSIADLVHPIASGHSDMVIGSRYVDGGSSAGWPIRRLALSRLGAAFAAPFTDVADPMSGFFAIRREFLLAAGEQAEGFKIGLEAVYAGGVALRVREVPISFSDRQQGTSKIGVSQFAAYLSQLARFSRGSASSDGMQRFLLVGMAGFFVDFAVLSAVWALGADIAIAHISGFCLAAAFNYVCHARWSFQGRPRVGQRSARFLLVSVLALAMRGGFVAAASGFLGLPFFWAALAGIGGGGIVSYLGNEFYVFRGNARLPPSTQWKLAALAVVAYVFVLRLVYQGGVDLIPQEAYYWNYAQRLAWGYLDHPPMVAWLIWGGTAIFGDTEFGVRIGATLSWLATAFFVYRLADNLFGRTQAFLAIMLLSVLPFFWGIGLLMTPDASLTAAWAGALYFLERAMIGKRARAWFGVGVCVGLGMLSKYTIALLGPATLVYLLVDRDSRFWLFTRWPYLCGGVAVLLFSPVIAWNAAHNWASFAFQGSRRWLASDIHFSSHELALYIAALLGPVGLILAGSAAGQLARFPEWTKRRQAEIFTLVYTLGPLSVFLFFSLYQGVKLNWTGPIWLALLPAMANSFTSAIRDVNRARLVAALKIGLAASVLLFSIFLHYLSLGLPLVGYPDNLRGLPIAWEEFGSEAQAIKARTQAETGYSPLLVGMDTYNIASELGFYSKGRTALTDITSQNLFDRGGLMYGVWGADLPSARNTVVMFALKESQISANGVAGWFERIGPVERRVVRKNDVPAGHFFYRVGYGFRKPGP